MPAGDDLEIWTIYEDPLDYPGMFIARKFIYDKPTSIVLVADTLFRIRSMIPDGLACLPRHPDDDPKIVECWL